VSAGVNLCFTMIPKCRHTSHCNDWTESLLPNSTAAVNWLMKPHLCSVPSSTHVASQPWSQPCPLQLSFHRCYLLRREGLGPRLPAAQIIFCLGSGICKQFNYQRPHLLVGNQVTNNHCLHPIRDSEIWTAFPKSKCMYTYTCTGQ